MEGELVVVLAYLAERACPSATLGHRFHARTGRLLCQVGTGQDCQHGSTLLNVAREKVLKLSCGKQPLDHTAKPCRETW